MNAIHARSQLRYWPTLERTLLYAAPPDRSTVPADPPPAVSSAVAASHYRCERREQKRTCALTELGFVRVSMQVFGYTRQQAAVELAQMKKGIGFIDDAPSPKLPEWVTTAARTSDGYLVQLAAAAGITLATFDARIKDPAVTSIP